MFNNMASFNSKRVMFKSPLKVHDKSDWNSTNDTTLNSSNNTNNINVNYNNNTNNTNTADNLHLFKTYIMSMNSDSYKQHYDLQRKQSTDSGVDNPFLPGSELSREADIIVKLIKEGKPITPTKENDLSLSLNNNNNQNSSLSPQQLSSSSPGINGTSKSQPPGVVEVQHGIVVPPNDSSQTVEQVVIKKKHKCCVVQ